VACPKGYFALAGTDPIYYCEECPLEGQVANGGTCTCDNSLTEQSTFCVDSTLYDTATGTYNPGTSISIKYDPVTTGSSLTTATVSVSDTINYLLPQALYECLVFKTDKQCQILANLCVYQMYNEAEAPCAAYRTMLTSVTTEENTYYDSGWRENLPWLYYQSGAETVIEKDSRIQGRIEFQSSSSSSLGLLRFVAAKYSLEGDFLGYEDLTTQLQL
jgi:hypothetical protein